MAHRLSCTAGCGIFLDQGPNPCLLHCRQILGHQTTREASATFLRFMYQLSSVAQLCPTLCNPINHSSQASLSITSSRSLLKLMPIESVVPCIASLKMENCDLQQVFFLPPSTCSQLFFSSKHGAPCYLDISLFS